MKRGIIIFTYVLLAGGLVYFAVTANMAEKRADRLNKALLDAETRLIEMESEMLSSEFSSPTPAAPSQSETQPAAPTTPADAPAATSTPSAAAQPAAATAVMRFVPLTAAGTTNLIRIEGTSSVHDWQAEGKIIGGMAEMEPIAPLLSGSDISGRAIRAKVNSFIPVRSLRSVEKDGSPYSSAMDEIMFGKLDAQNHGRIFYSLTSLTARERAGNPGGILCDAQGQLAVAGRTNDVTMEVTIAPRGEKALQLTGSCKLKMTDFGIEPPSPSLGGVSIKTGDEVTLKFVWTVENR